MATIYLIHFDRPLHHAKHYLGYTVMENVSDRLARHKRGDGARILKKCNELGISYAIVKTWECNDKDARRMERRLKNLHNSPKLCPICNKESVKCIEINHSE